MRMPVTFAAIVMTAGLFWSAPGMTQGNMAQSNAPDPSVTATQNQMQPRVKRVRPRILVQPRYPYSRYHSVYPRPYDVESPGPHAKRDCSVRYVSEYRPSGTVVVPRMSCWWVRG